MQQRELSIFRFEYKRLIEMALPGAPARHTEPMRLDLVAQNRLLSLAAFALHSILIYFPSHEFMLILHLVAVVFPACRHNPGQKYLCLYWGCEPPPGLNQEQGCVLWFLVLSLYLLEPRLPGRASWKGVDGELRMNVSNRSLICKFNLVSPLRRKAWFF